MSSFVTPSPFSDASFQAIDIDHALQFEHPAAQRGYALWCDMADGRDMPDRRDINPGRFAADLRHLSLFNLSLVDGTLDSISARVIGSEFESIFGPLTDRPLDEALNPQVLARWFGAANAVITQGKALRATGNVAHEDRQHVAFECVLAPMSDAHQKFAILYVVSVFTVKPLAQ